MPRFAPDPPTLHPNLPLPRLARSIPPTLPLHGGTPHPAVSKPSSAGHPLPAAAAGTGV